MDQSLSGVSGKPLRMTLTVICLFRETSDTRQIIACADLSKIRASNARKTPIAFKTASLFFFTNVRALFIPQRRRRVQPGGPHRRKPRSHYSNHQEQHRD